MRLRETTFSYNCSKYVIANLEFKRKDRYEKGLLEESMLSNIDPVQSYTPYSAFIICCDQCAVEKKQRKMLELINRLANEFKVFCQGCFAFGGNSKGSHDAISQIPKNFILKEIRADRENNELILEATSAWDCYISRLPQPKPKSKEENSLNLFRVFYKKIMVSAVLSRYLSPHRIGS
jgi:hypothetical protein